MTARQRRLAVKFTAESEESIQDKPEEDQEKS
jgi:hypothetical protein